VSLNCLRQAALVGAIAAGALLAAPQTPQTTPDNTRVNKRDRSKAEQTADQAKNNTSDRELMANIRKAVVDDKSLSMNAHNVKIVAKNGKVTLKGPVESEEEKAMVVKKATEVAGDGNVIDQISIKAARVKKDKS
jgi:hyperosmotically inducible periplasmic protein